MIYRSQLLENIQWTLKMDLVNDFRLGSKHALEEMGYAPLSIETAPKELFNVNNMLISQAPREVIYSAEFNCPKEYEVALVEFVAKVQNGENLTPFLSEKIQQSTNKDALLNDWGIHHFHLTRRFRTDGIAQRSQYQIFAYVTEVNFYMIQIYPHNKNLIYCQQEMVEILHTNWPKLIERYKLRGATNVVPKPSDSDISILRNKGAITLIELSDGTVYFPIGGGYASDRTSTKVMRQSNYWHNTLKQCEIAILADMMSLFKNFKSVLFREPKYNLVIRFYEARNNTIYLFEETNRVDIIIQDIDSNKCNMYCSVKRYIA